MKKILIILLFITNPLLAENIGPIGNYNVNQLLQDDNLTYKVIKGCVLLNSAVTERNKKTIRTNSIRIKAINFIC